jgi:O-antigen/teichoic acid export membrane protein
LFDKNLYSEPFSNFIEKNNAMEKHVNVIAALQIGLSIFGIVVGIIILVILSTIGVLVHDKDASFILPLIGYIIAIFIFLMSVPGIIAGIGLMKHKEWGRILTLILSVISLLNFPLGTAIGAYCIWALVQDETVALFRPESKNIMV